jgi:hypothetical protein
MDSDNGVAGVVFSREQGLGLQFVDQVVESSDLALQVGIHVFTFFGKIEVSVDIARAARQIGVGGEYVLQALLLAHDLLRALGIRPQVRVGCLLFNFG